MKKNIVKLLYRLVGRSMLSALVFAAIYAGSIHTLYAGEGPPDGKDSFSPVEIGGRLELFIDRHLVESMDNAELRLHRPHPGSASEGPSGAYMTVLRDGDCFLGYYRAVAPDYEGRRRDGHAGERTCVVKSTDGLASVYGPPDGGELLTRPVVFEGRELVLNLATSVRGGVRVELQDADGNPIPGFTLDDCPTIIGDSIEHVVTWREGADVSEFAGRPVRLRFELRDADIYSYQFFQ